jgi:predicted nucleic acid-binding protein
MGTRYLLDTNVIIDFMGNKFSITAQKMLSAIIVYNHKVAQSPNHDLQD